MGPPLQHGHENNRIIRSRHWLPIRLMPPPGRALRASEATRRGASPQRWGRPSCRPRSAGTNVGATSARDECGCESHLLPTHTRCPGSEVRCTIPSRFGVRPAAAGCRFPQPELAPAGSYTFCGSKLPHSKARASSRTPKAGPARHGYFKELPDAGPSPGSLDATARARAALQRAVSGPRCRFRGTVQGTARVGPVLTNEGNEQLARIPRPSGPWGRAEWQRPPYFVPALL
jgi:hypothetical protein